MTPASNTPTDLHDFLRRLSEWDVLNLALGAGDDGPYWQGEIVKANAALDRLIAERDDARRAVVSERVERRRLERAAQEVEQLAFRQYLDWMHFHELAMTKPFEAETEAQDFAQRVSSLLTIALGDASTIEEQSLEKERL